MQSFLYWTSFRRDLTNALRINAVLINRPLQGKETESSRFKEVLSNCESIEKCIRSLLTALAGRRVRLSTSSLCLVLPLLVGVLGLPALLPGCEGAFMVLDGYA